MPDCIVLRFIFTISLLAILLYKVSEPLVVCLDFSKAMATPVPKVETMDDQIEIKVHAPLPYTSNWEETDPVQKCYQLGKEFYNIVERRYENDTLYFKLQRNLNARDKFDALSSILNTLNAEEKGQQPNKANAPSAKDFLTVFSPNISPVFVTNTYYMEASFQTTIWHYAFFLSGCWLAILVPPPDQV